jgi:cytochrome c biogenesis protein CcmG/thiol:disulfide interchange protein DsbE
MNAIIRALRYAIPFIFCLILFLFLWRGLQIDPRLLPSALINQPAPAFKLPTLENPQHYLTQKDLSGHITLLNIWASWCGACQIEHPFLMELARSQGIPIYAIDYKDQPADARQWLQKYGNPYRSIGVDAAGQTAINWGVYGTPETFVIDAQGIIRYKVIGALTPDVWHSEIAPLLLKLKKINP